MVGLGSGEHGHGGCFLFSRRLFTAAPCRTPVHCEHMNSISTPRIRSNNISAIFRRSLCPSENRVLRLMNGVERNSATRERASGGGTPLAFLGRSSPVRTKKAAAHRRRFRCAP